MKKYDLFIDGEWTKALTDDEITIVNPRNQEELGIIPACHEEDVNRAVKGAKEALLDWRMTDPQERADYLQKMKDYLVEHKEEIAKRVHLELGAPIKTVLGTHVEGYFGSMQDFIDLTRDYQFVDKYDDYEVHKEPVGVVACFTPWNFPFGQIYKKVFPALLMGNTVVLKPSQHTPITAYYYAKAAIEAGLPKGVLQLVTGRGKEIGEILSEHPDIRKLSLTGSTTAGRELMKNAADSFKRITFELGGKSPAIVLKDADLEYAVKTTLSQVYSNTGQACSSKTRLLVPRELKDQVEEIVVEESKKWLVGDPADEKTDIGPLHNEKQFDKVTKYIEIGKEEATLLYEGKAPDLPGYYVGPVVFTDVDPKATIAQDEIFGPVLSILFYDDIEEAIEIANDSIYGLHGIIFGDQEEAIKIAKRINTGQIIINDAERNHCAPFGGFKQSGIGREGGIYTLDEYTELKTLYIKR